MQIQILKDILRRTIAPLTILALLTIICLTGCQYGLMGAFHLKPTVDDRASSLKELTLPHEVTDSEAYKSGKYNFMMVTDMHYGASYDVPETLIISWLTDFDNSVVTKKQKPLFCLVLGDMVENGNKEDFAAFNTFQEKLKNDYKIPVYCIVGNHDLLNGGWQYWEENCYPYTSFYRFKTNGISWYFTDTGSGTMGSVQMSILEDAIKSDSNRKLVFSHYPLQSGDNGVFLFAMGNTMERARLIDLYARNDVQYVFDGHWHKGGGQDLGNFSELCSPTLKNGVWHLVSVDETPARTGNSITGIKVINIEDLSF